MKIPGIYSQRDGRWSGFLLGYNLDQAYNLYHYGCAVTGAANILLWATGNTAFTPKYVNDWLKNNGGFVKGGGLVIWGVLAKLMLENGIEYHGFTTVLNGANGTNAFLSPENNYALAQLKKPGFPMHFSGMPYVGQIGDSWDAQLKPVGSYTFIGAHLFTKIVKAAVAAAVPVPELSPAPIQTPAEAPAVSVPSVEKPIDNPNPETATPPVVTPSQTYEPPIEPGKGQGTEIPVAPTPGTIVEPEVPASPEEPAAPAEPEIQILRLTKPGWVEVFVAGGSYVYDIATGLPIELIPAGTKFQVEYFAEHGGHKYLITENMAKATPVRGIEPTTVRRASAPTVDAINTPTTETDQEVKLEEFGRSGRAFLKALHALFGDWHIFKKNKEK